MLYTVYDAYGVTRGHYKSRSLALFVADMIRGATVRLEQEPAR